MKYLALRVSLQKYAPDAEIRKDGGRKEMTNLCKHTRTLFTWDLSSFFSSHVHSEDIAASHLLL